ncbi:helix-turn-helix domain-containing protein [Leucobacter komagatae]|uniref:helix-turn-helix domain-containing protein n=1 Tax=Leucobacter komagatae TaxID=55969 RepID=UPI000AC127B9|nr:helix-turn-helix transcriptional regulator [Leucobacter komagatae]
MLGAELRRLRHKRGDTLGEIASRAGLSPQYLSEMERGVKDPSSEMVEAVAGALGVTLVDLARAVADELSGAQARDVRASTIRSSAAAHPRAVGTDAVGARAIGARAMGSPAVVLLAARPQATLALAA